ncbi:MAG: Segregation and condensation protein A [Candidatus Nomurabacteria bacterium GW2011_GWF2_35_12]|uniref:Segregation and condensation protein A n=3 Tax=Candidatus Nomuraibacteriota TaxID=1752729 RepID=A0A0G0GCG2_9BACT|nr:MAG: Segregation and condensation protein A [Candidatus Nomurabacteria bacterium GW2011_GWF2_35_12]KKP72673.1 MAG: Segregation and condensation protein A [Candidatus Nomurabacteria bacterium GW2011_GWB1_35_20]KKP76474.1 MAG: Segregation and condensation protein A [Parcubacteria group bacterium GW2011_GWC1_35_21]KKP78170.1 MAG: Segregation and condensation protein A [Candidatus Nomurabacteria bacterium GW2011_GWC2_35_35]KKP84996.1 MAG: Segregation and condensation protein A [Parcubacteria gro
MNPTETETYQIKTDAFEGPFHLLLSLIEERKFFINDLSLAQVTEDYLNYVNKLEKQDPSEISSFIVVAATLILIKSKSLLPNLNLTAEEEGDIRNLEDRLKLYELYTKLSINIKNAFGRKIIFAPLERKNDFLVFLPDDQITKESMMIFARDALGKVPKKVFLPEVEVKKVISIEEMISRLTERIEKTLEVSFKNFSGVAKTREEKIIVIIGFLAMLELVRQGILHAVQENIFEDIIIKKNSE